MSFINFPDPTPVFPALASLSWSTRVRPTFATLSAITVPGTERRATRACFPLWEFELTYESLADATQNQIPYTPFAGQDELQQISSLFLACNGDYGEFYYTHPEDFSRAGGYIATGNGVDMSFLTFKLYQPPAGGFPGAYDPIGGFNSILQVYLDGTPIFSGYAADGQYLTFSSPPGNNVVITADYTFYFRCRFTDPRQEYQQFLKNLWEYKVCRFRSVKP